MEPRRKRPHRVCRIGGFPDPGSGTWESLQLWVAVVARAGAVFSLALGIATVDCGFTRIDARSVLRGGAESERSITTVPRRGLVAYINALTHGTCAFP